MIKTKSEVDRKIEQVCMCVCVCVLFYRKGFFRLQRCLGHT